METFACNDCGHTILVGQTPDDLLCGGCRRLRERLEADESIKQRLASATRVVEAVRRWAKCDCDTCEEQACCNEFVPAMEALAAFDAIEKGGGSE